jgi:DNA polymerase-3 subunit gamma/tau
LSLLDQFIAFGGAQLTERNARAMLGTIDRRHVVRLIDALGRGDGAELLSVVREFDQDAPDYDRALVELAAYLQRIAIVQVVPDAARDEESVQDDDLPRLAAALTPEDAQLYYQIALIGRRDLNLAPDPRIGFEMTVLRMLAFRPGEDARGAGSSAAKPAPTAAKPSGEAQPASAPRSARGASAAAATPETIDAREWPRIVDAAGLSGMARQFALNCVPSSFADDVLHLRMDAAAADRRTRQVEERLLQALGRHFGRPVRVSFEVAESDLATPARQRQRAEQDRVAGAVAAFADDPAVKGLRERFGAEIDVASIKPAN